MKIEPASCLVCQLSTEFSGFLALGRVVQFLSARLSCLVSQLSAELSPFTSHPTIYRQLGGTTSYLAAQTKNILSHRAVKERPISPRGRRRSYLDAFTISTWPQYTATYDALHPCDEMGRSSSARWDRTFFNRPV